MLDIPMAFYVLGVVLALYVVACIWESKERNRHSQRAVPRRARPRPR
jgi:hypothetical protein